MLTHRIFSLSRNTNIENMKKIFFQLIAFLYYLSDLIEKRERACAREKRMTEEIWGRRKEKEKPKLKTLTFNSKLSFDFTY